MSNGQSIYVRGTAATINNVNFGPFITGVITGLQNARVDVGMVGVNTFTSIRAVGGSIELYNNAADYQPAQGPTGSGINLDAGQYNGITNTGNLLLSGVFAPGAVILGDTTSSYTSNYNNATLSGNAQAFLNFTGGTALPFFDNNLVPNANGGFNDAFLNVTFNDVSGVASSLGWTVASSGDFRGAVASTVSEPSSLALLSIALLGLGATARRRNNEKQG